MCASCNGGVAEALHFRKRRATTAEAGGDHERIMAAAARALLLRAHREEKRRCGGSAPRRLRLTVVFVRRLLSSAGVGLYDARAVALERDRAWEPIAQDNVTLVPW